ncbi:hypothetical protein Tco_0708800 [Tanacetum coccineum]
MIHLHCDYRSFTEITYLPRRELCFFCILDSLFLMVDTFEGGHSTDHSSSDSSSEASSDFHSDASSDSSSRHSLSDHSSPDLPGTSAGPSRKRRRSPMTSVPALSPISGALSPVRADLIPSPKRVRDSGYLTDVEVDHRETSLRDDAIVRVSDEPHLEQDSDPEIHAEIDECFAYADALKIFVMPYLLALRVEKHGLSDKGSRGGLAKQGNSSMRLCYRRVKDTEKEKLEWWFEQDIDDEGEEDEEGEGGSEV